MCTVVLYSVARAKCERERELGEEAGMIRQSEFGLLGVDHWTKHNSRWIRESACRAPRAFCEMEREQYE
jgi:hypothetical protein